MCDHQLFDGPLICTHDGEHTGGHTYTATSPGDPEPGYDE